MRTGRRYLVQLDCLFDTRIGWARVTHPEAVKRLDMDVYRKRHTEIWADTIGIPNWTKLYTERDKRALMESGPTEFLLGLKNQILADVASTRLSSPMEKPIISVNMWPYDDLTDSEREMFSSKLRALYNEVQVELVYLPLQALSLGQLNSMWDGWYMYDWFYWVKMHANDFGAKRTPEFIISPPAILTSELTADIVDAIEKDGVNPFVGLTRFMEEIVTVDPVDARMFSLLHFDLDAAEQTPSP